MVTKANENNLANATVDALSKIGDASKDFGSAMTEHGKLASAATTAVSDISKEIKEILIIVKYTLVISVAGAGLFGAYYAISYLRKKK